MTDTEISTLQVRGQQKVTGQSLAVQGVTLESRTPGRETQGQWGRGQACSAWSGKARGRVEQTLGVEAEVQSWDCHTGQGVWLQRRGRRRWGAAEVGVPTGTEARTRPVHVTRVLQQGADQIGLLALARPC